MILQIAALVQNRLSIAHVSEENVGLYSGLSLMVAVFTHGCTEQCHDASNLTRFKIIETYTDLEDNDFRIAPLSPTQITKSAI